MGKGFPQGKWKYRDRLEWKGLVSTQKWVTEGADPWENAHSPTVGD